MSQFHQNPVSFIDSITLLVKNIDSMADFYHRVLGFQVLENFPHRISLGVDNHPLVTLVSNDQVTLKASYRTGLYHVAFLLPTRADLASFYEHITHVNGIEGASDHGVSEAIYLSDPEGNGIEVYVDRPSEDWPRKNNQLMMVTLPLMTRSLLAVPHSKWTLIPSGTVLGHLHLHADHLAKMEEFFTLLGFDVQQRYGPSALFLGSSGYHHHIGLNTWNGVGAKQPTESMTGLKAYHITLADSQYALIRHALVTRGVAVKENHDSIELTDPLGHLVIISK